MTKCDSFEPLSTAPAANRYLFLYIYLVNSTMYVYIYTVGENLQFITNSFTQIEFSREIVRLYMIVYNIIYRISI